MSPTDQKKIPATATVPNSDYIIFGGTGDLSCRKIVPALFWRWLDGQLDEMFRIYLVARQVPTMDDFAETLRPFCKDALASQVDAEAKFQDFLRIMKLQAVNVLSGEGGKALADSVRGNFAPSRPCIFYLAVAPSLFGASCQLIKTLDLAAPQCRLVVEKPLGSDGKSARDINDELQAVFSEEQIYRIDHYLGKETVQNLMALRFANVLFENQWSNQHIDHVQITVAENIGIGQRGSYYDRFGALRDMVQNHLLQLLCLVAMEPPAKFSANQVRDEKLRVLRALRPVQSDDVKLGQYADYTNELGTPSNTETYVALRCQLDNWRWAGVPFYLRTGKKMSVRASEIVISFKQAPHDIFSRGKASRAPNRLIIRLQPHEGLRLQLTSKAPGPGGMRLRPSELNLSFDEAFEQRLPDAYERLLMDIARGNQTLFMRLDEVLAAWDFVDPIIEMAQKTKPEIYRSGSMGPVDSLFDGSHTGWIDLKEEGK